MQIFKAFLPRTLKEMRAEDALEAGRVFGAWPDIVGPAIAPRTRPRFLRAGVLFVEVASSAWANELTMLKPRILSALAERLGKGRIKDVRWQVAPTWSERAGQVGEVLVPEPSPAPLPALPAAESAAIQASVQERVSDPDLAKTMGTLMETVARRRAAKERAGYRPCPTCGALMAPQGPDGPCPICRLTGSKQ